MTRESVLMCAAGPIFRVQYLRGGEVDRGGCQPYMYGALLSSFFLVGITIHF